MKIQFLVMCYAPEEVSGAVLVTELAADLARRGHEVTVVAPVPNYPLGVVFPGYRNALYQVEWIDGVRVVRIWSYISPDKAAWKRVLFFGTFCCSAFWGGLFAGRPDILISYSPPLPLGTPAWLLSRVWNIPWVLHIMDLYPEAAVAAGLLRSRSLISIFSKQARFYYRHARHIAVISDRFRQIIEGLGIPGEKISLIPVWADPWNIFPAEKENSFRRKHHIDGKFVVMYAGNMGFTSSLEDVLDASRILKEDPEVQFVFVGEGVLKKHLMKRASQQGLDRILFLPYQPRESFNEMMAAADVSLVTLNTKSSSYSLPSKTFNIMASGRPLLAVTPDDSELARIVSSAGCGLHIPPHDPQRLAEAIHSMKKDRVDLERMGSNGRAEVERTYCRSACVDSYEKMLEDLLNRPTPAIIRKL